MSAIASYLPIAALGALLLVVGLICYALKIKGDVFAELTHGKTTIRIDARDRRHTRCKTVNHL